MKIYKKLLGIIIVFATALFMYSCDPADNRLKIVNESIMGIYFFYSCDSTLNDMSITRNGYYANIAGERTYLRSNQYIEKESFRNIPKRGFNAWPHSFDNCENDKMHFYFFIDSIVNKYDDYEIRYNKLYEKHLIFTAKELKQNNWIITFQR